MRWCVCSGHRDVGCPFEIAVLMHHREMYRPSSTGHLINRVIPGSQHHLWRRERHLTANEVHVPGRDLWILHPHGEPAPRDVAPETVQVLLLDGAWGETSMMAKELKSWGRIVSLPMKGESRYWLRNQQDGGRFSTIEALMYLLRSFGLGAGYDDLRLQFELHVYANLRARGRKHDAELFLNESPLTTACPDLLTQLNTRRPR